MTHKHLEQLTIGELLTLIVTSSGTEQIPLSADSAAAAPAPVSGNRLIPVTEWNKHHSWPPTGGLRWLIFNEKLNSFDKVVRRVGRRCLIDEAAFFEWVRNGAGKQVETSTGSSGRSVGRPRADGRKGGSSRRGSK